MRPVKLTLQAFGPFVEKQTVDFEKLSQSGIFLIKGKTGSGKTTIFDAMMFALYGGGSGETDKIKNGRNNIGEWRCTQAPDDLETFVDFEFSSNGTGYYFKRILKLARKNFKEEYEAGVMDEDGNRHPFFDNPKEKLLNDKAAELVGLDKEQFRQVVLLPQGQFEKFLTASSGQKEEILQKIFGADRWKKYADAFYAAALDEKNKLDDEKNTVISSLKEEGLNNLDELKERIEALEAQLEKLGETHRLFEGDKKREELNRDIKLSEQFKPLHCLEAEVKALENMRPEIDGKRKTYEESEKAESVRGPVHEYEEAKKQAAERQKNFSELKSVLEKAGQEQVKAETAKKAHDEASPVEELTKTVLTYTDKKDAYENFSTVKKDFEDAEKLLKAAEKERNKASEEHEKSREKAGKALAEYNEAIRVAGDFRNRYYAGIYGELAGQLVLGEKCPVCGSTEHPSPAVKLPDSVSKEDMETKEAAAEMAKKIWDCSENKRSEVETRKHEKENAWNQANQGLIRARAELDAVKKNLIDGIDDSAALDEKIAELKAKIQSYQDETNRLQNALDNAKIAFTKLNEKIESAKKEVKNASEKENTTCENAEAAVLQAGFTDFEEVKRKLLDAAERRKMHEDIVAYDAKWNDKTDELSKKRTELADQVEPDAERFDEREKEIVKEASNYNTESTACSQEIKRLQGKFGNLHEIEDHYKKEIDGASRDLAFAKALRGDTGIGIQRYVLAVMFNQVIGEANRMLEKVHGGRYRLYRTDERGQGNKTGLELKAHDSRSPEKEGRNVSMLSGGEKFLVSLALSIGMSTIAQTSGMRIEALFIDEGFGTLDDSSIHDALDILDSVRKGNGMIGIISHVQLLEDNIPTHLDVLESENGSRIS